MKEATASVNQFVKAQPPETRKIIEKLRAMIRDAMPNTQEIVYHGALGYSPTGAPYDRIIYVMTSKSHVTLGFFFGSHLPDPGHRLEGEGKRMRHVKIRTLEGTDDLAIKNLVKAAREDATSSLESLHKKWGIHQAEEA